MNEIIRIPKDYAGLQLLLKERQEEVESDLNHDCIEIKKLEACKSVAFCVALVVGAVITCAAFASGRAVDGMLQHLVFSGAVVVGVGSGGAAVGVMALFQSRIGNVELRKERHAKFLKSLLKGQLMLTKHEELTNENVYNHAVSEFGRMKHPNAPEGSTWSRIYAKDLPNLVEFLSEKREEDEKKEEESQIVSPKDSYAKRMEEFDRPLKHSYLLIIDDNHPVQIDQRLNEKSFDYQDKLRTNSVLRVINRIGHMLTAPTSMLLEDGARVFVCQLTPGMNGQAKTMLGEVLTRIALVVRMPFLLLSTLTIGWLGAGLRMVTTGIAREDICMRSIKADQRLPLPADKKRLVVGQWNLGGGPDMMSRRNKLLPACDRVNQWIKVIVNQLISCDVIMLQEGFHTEAVEMLIERLNEVYPYAIYNVGSRSMTLNSGLVMLSKFPLEKPRFWPYGVNRVGDDIYANKGLLAATARISQSQSALLFNTHLNGGGKNAMQCRALQLKAINDHQREYRETELKRDSESVSIDILGGDFNVGRYTEQHTPEDPREDPDWDFPEWQELLAASQPMDESLTDGTKYFMERSLRDRQGQGNRKPESLDFQFVPKGYKSKRERRTIVDVGGASDGAALFCEYSLV